MGLSLKQVANIIGEDPDLTTCACSSHINEWSFVKPINDSSMTSLTTRDFFDNNDGFMLFTFNTPQRLLYEIQHPNASNIWRYMPREAPFRLTDFNGYDNYAQPLCTLQFVGDNTGNAGGTIRLECNDVADIIRHWKYFEGVRSYVDFIFLIYTYGTEFDQSGEQGVYVYKITSMVDYEDDGIFRLTIPNDLTSGQYEIRLACTTATSMWNDRDCLYVNSSNPLPGVYYALPHHCKALLTVTSGGGGTSTGGGGGGTSTDYFNYLGIDFYNASYEYNESSLTLGNVTFTNYIVINSSTNKTFNLYIEYYYDNAAAPVRLGTASRSLSEEGTPWATINVNFRDQIYLITGANLSDRIAIRAELSLTVNNVGYTKTINTTIERV